jgi:hypothetical protein
LRNRPCIALPARCCRSATDVQVPPTRHHEQDLSRQTAPKLVS